MTQNKNKPCCNLLLFGLWLNWGCGTAPPGPPTHLSPLPHTEDPVGVVPVLPNTMQLHRVAPLFGEIFICTEEEEFDQVT